MSTEVLAATLDPTISASWSSSRSSSASPHHRGSGMGLGVGQCVSDSAPCPDGKGRSETDYTTLFSGDETVCFAANLVEGDCYAVSMTPQGTDAPFTLEDCADSRAMIKVAQRFDDQTNKALCPAATKPVTYHEPGRLYCFQPAHQ